MKAPAEPHAPATEVTTPSALDRAEGVELLGDVHGSGYEKGAALVRRADGQMVQLGPLMYALLDSLDGRRTPAELADAMSERLGRRVGEQHIRRIAEKLARQGLLAGTEQNAPPRRNPLLALRWKAIVTNPKWTRRLTAPFVFLFSPFVIAAVVAGFVVVAWFVLFDKGVASATSDAFDKPGLLLLVFVLAVASAGFHEFGHAAACRYGGATPGAMGMGIYLVWPAFYTDVTDAYRLPRRDRLRVDLGGLYFNAIVAVVTAGIWLAWRVDALLLLVALQLLMMVKNLSPVIRSDGYHILADATGVPDLYAHIGPTLRRLIPGRPAEPSALKGRARLLVTLWVLVIVPVLLSLMFGAVLLLPRMAATAWDSGRAIAGGMPHEAADVSIVAFLSSLVRLFALVLPLLGSALITQRLARMFARKSHAWSEGRPARRAAVVGVATLAATAAAWAWWPAGQYEPVHAADAATLTGFGHVIASPVSYVRPVTEPARPTIAPGTHLALAMIPVGGVTKAHPALLVLPGDAHHPAVAILSSAKPGARGSSTPVETTTLPTTTVETATTTTPATTSTTPQAPAPPPADGVAFDFKLPAPPGPGDTQALAVNHTNGGVVYDVAYALVTVSGGAPVTNTNGAFAFANCKACTTVAVSFQVVLIVGRSASIAPIDAAGSLNVDCPACLTTAIADQIVVTLTKQPSKELVDQIESALQKLNALPSLGANGTPAAVAAEVGAVQQQVESALQASGALAKPLSTTASTTTSTTPTTTAPSTTTNPTTTAPTGTAPTATTPTTTAHTTTAPTTTAQTTTTAPTTTTSKTTTTTPTTTAETTTTTPSTTTEPSTTTTATTTTTPTTTSGG